MNEDTNFDMTNDDVMVEETAAAPKAAAAGGDEPQVFVRGLPFSAGEQEIEEYFNAAGTVRKVKLMTNESGQSKGSAIVTFANADAVAAAIERFDNAMFGDRKINVEKARGRTPEGSQLFVKVSFDVTEDDLQELFGQAGQVTRVKIPNEDGRSKGFGFITMANAEQAQAAISKFDGYEFKGWKMQVRIAEDRPRSNDRGPRQFGGGERRGGFRGNDRRDNGGYGRDNYNRRDDNRGFDRY